jgi:uncharacterized protein YcfJ
MIFDSPNLIFHRSTVQEATTKPSARYAPVTKEKKMKSKLAMAALITLVAAPTVIPAEASARHVYRGHDRNYRHRCGGGNGAVGTIAGGAGGALLGNAVGGGVLGTVAGGVGGALLGRHLDKTHSRHRNGC